MNQQTNRDVNIAPQLDKACGLDMHKEKIVGFISCKDGSEQELMEFGTFTCELHKVKDWLQSNDGRRGRCGYLYESFYANGRL